MTDLCAQCTIERYGYGVKSNLSNQITKQQFYSGLVIKSDCEDCGETYVDDKGQCTSKHCSKNHGDY